MNEMKHTPGPWVVHELPNGRGTSYSVGQEKIGPEHTVARVMAINGRRGVVVHNAHMIASAPEMYEALHNLLAKLSHYADAQSDAVSDERWHFEVSPAIRAARAAIAKAEDRAALSQEPRS